MKKIQITSTKSPVIIKPKTMNVRGVLDGFNGMVAC